MVITQIDPVKTLLSRTDPGRKEEAERASRTRETDPEDEVDPWERNKKMRK